MDNSIIFDSASLVKCVWIAFLAEIVLVIPIAVMGSIAFYRAPVDKNPAYTFSQLFERAKTLQMMTVILIVVAATFLALCNIINSNGVVGILSGIAGYVLGSLPREPREKKEDDQNKLNK